MKKSLTIFISLLFICTVYLAIKGNEMQEIKTEIEIHAPPEKVWEELTNIKKWKEWSPIINNSKGDVSVGSKLSITMKGKEENKDGPIYNPVITKIEKPHILRWRAHMIAGFIFTNYKVFELKESDVGTIFTHKEMFSGVLAPLFCGQMKESVTPMLNAMNKALKDLIEK